MRYFFSNFVAFSQYLNIKNLTDDEFNEVITTLIKQKSQADVTLHEEFTRYWNEITNSEYLFDRNQQEIKLLESCDKKEMIKFMSNLLASDKARVLMRSKTEKHRRKLSVQVIGKVIYPKYYKNLNESSTFLCLGRLDHHGSTENFLQFC